MATVAPFKGFIPKADMAEKVAALPYDVMSTKEAKEMAKGNPHSFLHVEKSEIVFPDDFDGHSEPVYQKASENLEKMIADGVFIQSAEPCFYIYKQVMGKVAQTGLVAGYSVEEYDKQIVKKHELTRKDKEDDRVNNVDKCNANTGLVFLTYPHQKQIDELVAKITSRKPYIDYVAVDKIVHTLWIVEDKSEIEKFVKLFEGLKYLYIADGHHRSAAASRVCAMRKARNQNHSGKEGYNFCLAVIFPDNQLNCMDYNRVLKDMNGLTPETLLAKLREKFIVNEIKVKDANDAKPQKRREMAMYLDNKWYKMCIKDEFVSKDPVKSLDVSILQDNVLAPFFDIKDPRTDKRIDFVGGIRGMDGLVKRCHEDCKVAFALFATGIDQLMAIADAGEIMPPKSTWFEPKLRSGMIVKSLD
ncbi:MAG TPA: DUF1015 domain-containing protein [Lentisphaeria bacterium]|nr:MAG: hypothetical protein A2X47_10470 [Lentisphaerae bacterium GWF2_38_69]HBM15028.1 DUF1015 domain-containing protein [Lentisphaeria bacterium]